MAKAASASDYKYKQFDEICFSNPKALKIGGIN